MSGEKHDRPRRHIRTVLIEPFKQIKFGMYVMTISMLFMFLAAFLFWQAFWEQYQHVMGIFNIVDPKLQWELVTDDVFRTNAIRLAIAFGGYLSILFAIVFWLTHRYYGPLISIERFVDEMAEGQYRRRVKIRQGDELQRLAAKLNDMADKLQGRHGPGDDRRGPAPQD